MFTKEELEIIAKVMDHAPMTLTGTLLTLPKQFKEVEKMLKVREKIQASIEDGQTEQKEN